MPSPRLTGRLRQIKETWVGDTPTGVVRAAKRRHPSVKPHACLTVASGHRGDRGLSRLVAGPRSGGTPCTAPSVQALCSSMCRTSVSTGCVAILPPLERPPTQCGCVCLTGQPFGGPRTAWPRLSDAVLTAGAQPAT